LVAIVRFEKNLQGLWRLAHEHIYWDQAGVLAQVGLLDSYRLFSQMWPCFFQRCCLFHDSSVCFSMF
jgi:hypothetical protein